MTTTKDLLVIRTYVAEDEYAVLQLLSASLGGGPTGTRSAEFFRWKHRDSPFGPSLMIVAEQDAHIVGLRAFMRWKFDVSGRTIHAVRAVDTATHPDHQGRGIFTKLTLAALNELRPNTDLVFNTPNEGLPGYLKMGWRSVGSLPVRVRVKHPIRFLRRLRSVGEEGPPPKVDAASVGDVLADGRLATLLEHVEQRSDRLSTPRNLPYLRWRYAEAPLLDYRAVMDERGIAIFRLRRRGGLMETTVAELIVAEGGVSAASHLLRSVVRVGRADHVTASFVAHSSSARAARRCGFVPSPRGVPFITNPLRDGIEPDPTLASSWYLTAGDLEVF